MLCLVVLVLVFGFSFWWLCYCLIDLLLVGYLRACDCWLVNYCAVVWFDWFADLSCCLIGGFTVDFGGLLVQCACCGSSCLMFCLGCFHARLCVYFVCG